MKWYVVITNSEYSKYPKLGYDFRNIPAPWWSIYGWIHRIRFWLTHR